MQRSAAGGPVPPGPWQEQYRLGPTVVTRLWRGPQALGARLGDFALTTQELSALDPDPRWWQRCALVELAHRLCPWS